MRRPRGIAGNFLKVKGRNFTEHGMETAMHDAYESKNDRIHEFIPKADFWTGKMMCVGCKTISTTNGKSILTSPSM